MEVCLIEPTINKFAYVFRIKTLVKHERFLYTTRWGLDVKGIVGLCSNMGQWKDKLFFYPSRHSGNFRTVCKWQPVCRPSSIWLLLYFSNSFFFADPRLHPMLKEEEAIHLDIFNGLSEEKMDFKILVTTTKLSKHGFYSSGLALPKNS